MVGDLGLLLLGCVSEITHLQVAAVGSYAQPGGLWMRLSVRTDER
jgi:hypothetical protein